ncbi:FtsK-like domain-containing protein [Roseimaritima multifibrata]|uniref:FtsK-like domain-containing protein n=1 Tax=Roseimaritima multifibrata TaxID=1930274 RepID=A0A517MD72_9BACT|nr:FtsK/SpoIIIE domain-containing protein [Roseimaritima multifibrata]QDS92843.1 FtsK-like domain-containing protein [Roseimaritima multifibrata]
MPKTLPAPTGLLSPQRQERLLRGLMDRAANADKLREKLAEDHAAELKNEQEQAAQLRQQTLQDCRQQRNNFLRTWDDANERLISKYETETVELRTELKRLAVRFEQKRKEEHQAIANKVRARCAAVQHQYETQKPLPTEKRLKHESRLDQAMLPLVESLDEVRDVTARRLSGLPTVPPIPESDQEAAPESVQEAVDAIETANRMIRENLRKLYSSTPSKLVDTFWILPLGAAIFVLCWSIGCFLFVEEHLLIALLSGLGTALFLFFSVLAILQFPLRRQTRRDYPAAEHFAAMGERAAKTGRAIAKKKAQAFAQDLLKTRDFHLKAAERWQREHIAETNEKLAAHEKTEREQLQGKQIEIGMEFQRNMDAVDQKMHTQAEELTAQIQTRLQRVEEDFSVRQERLLEKNQSEIEHFNQRFTVTVERGLQRIRDYQRIWQERFPVWQTPPQCSGSSTLDYLPVGRIDIHDPLRQVMGQSATYAGVQGSPDSASEALPQWLPVALHRRLHAGIVIDCPPEKTEKAVELVHSLLWNAFRGVTPGRCQATLLDPIGRGQHFAGLIALSDHDGTLVNNRVWTAPAQIETRLAEWTQHNEDVLQSCLRDQFDTIEDYNQIAGSLAEPYRIVAGVGLPGGITPESANHLRAMVDSARRCGTFLILVRDETLPWPKEFPSLEDPRLMRMRIDSENEWSYLDHSFSKHAFLPCAPPPIPDQLGWTEVIGQAAVAANRVEIPLQKILPAGSMGTSESSDTLEIPIGSQGAYRSLALKLGEGVRQHVLIAGKTGSGKSTLLHTIITAGAMLYTPAELQMYLLDFKKGVEFKAYADGPLPHARVIGIESEREFGRSVLQRLDAELQQRGEQFREARVQDLGGYRKATHQSLPRILLVIDEFQEIFLHDDRIAADCAMYLDRLVRQGRSFGMHVILSSQSLAGSYALPRATLGQMAVRIALQSSEADAALILADDNPAARVINRPGEAIYNDAGGLTEGNQPFQIAWLSGDEQQRMLAEITARDSKWEAEQDHEPVVIFEGNRPTKWTPRLLQAAFQSKPEGARQLRGLLGESIEIGPPTLLRFQPQTGRNALVVATAEPTLSVLTVALSSMFADWQDRYSQSPEIVLLDGNRISEEGGERPSDWLQATGLTIESVSPRDCESELNRLNALVAKRLAEGDEAIKDQPPTVIVITPLERFRELRQSDSYQFSLNEQQTLSGSDALQSILKDGPQAGVYTILCCQTAETLTRWLPRSVHHDLEIRLLGRMSSADSANLIDTPIASDLTAATMLMYDDADGSLKKFRLCERPEASEVASWLDSVNQGT